ncbi:MAG: NUDIX hydrolase [Candidatus Eremiobacteraeota bacterium]|nr:NUDIX hydrolase [Candidatus Eremiobacteraeota bacterium]
MNDDHTAQHARTHLVTGILQRAGAVLLVASRYPNHREPLWNLPGGRQRHGELLADTLRREFIEETSLTVSIGALRYVAESYDRAGGAHFTNFTFDVDGARDPRLPEDDDHVVALAWVPYADLAERLRVGVVREPLLTNLRDPSRRYFAFADAGITIEFPNSP